MRSLFFKIFVAFWLSHLMAVAFTYGALSAAQSQRDEDDRRNEARRFPSTLLSAGLLSRHANKVSRLYAEGGARRANAYLSALEERSGARLHLFDAQGRQIAGEKAASRASELARRVAKSHESEFASSRDGLIGAYPVNARESNLTILIAHRSRSRTIDSVREVGDVRVRTSGRVDVPEAAERLGLGRRGFYEATRYLGLLVAAGLVAFGLARYVTTPAIKLRRATQRLADGDLSARVGPQMGRRRDELADLGRDFDVMAGRIEHLMLSERRLLGDISHELRSPLARLQVALDLANQTADADTRGYLDRIERESGRLNALIGQLLTLTRLEAASNGSADARRSANAQQSVDLSALVSDVCEDADFEAQGRNRRVRVTQSAPCFTTGNADLLRSAVENVVRNAVLHAPESTEVEVALQATNNQAVIRVRDTGPGVPEDALAELFKPFYRVAEARDRQSGGVGLGLSITERAVRFHGGSVQASNAEGGGLLVEITLPIAA